MVDSVEFPFILEYENLVLQIPGNFNAGFFRSIRTREPICLGNPKCLATRRDFGALFVEAEIGKCRCKANPMPRVSPRPLEEGNHVVFKDFVPRSRL
jgi:hypothetical protein